MSGFEGLLSGRTLVDRYRIEEVIGRGGFAAVYRAVDERLGRTVAVKVITVAAPDPESRDRLRARFGREARAAASIQHPNVVTVYDFGTDPMLELDFLVMELLAGEDLATYLQGVGAPPLPLAVRIVREAGEGIAAGHRRGMVHRDVKPGNLFLARREGVDPFRVCVLDFGIAQIAAADEAVTRLTQAGEGFLSPAYASPEQLRGERNLTPASDVFSLGVIGFQLLTGERPFARERWMDPRAREGAIPSLRERNPAVPPELEAAIRRALAPDPEDRFADAGAFADAVAAVEPLPAAPPPPPRAAAPTTPPVPPALVPADIARLPTVPFPAGGRTPAPARPVRRDRARRPLARIAATLLLLAGVGAAGWWMMDGGTESVAVQTPPPATLEPRASPEPTPEPVEPTPKPVEPAPDPAGEPETAAPPVVAPQPEAPVPAPATGNGSAGSANREGQRLFDRGRYAAAVEPFRRATGAAPDNAFYRNNLGWALFRAGEVDAAGRELETALRLDPERDIAYANLGEVRLAQGDTTGAIAVYEHFLELNTNPNRERIARQKLDRIRGGGSP